MGVYYAYICLKIGDLQWVADSEKIMQIDNIRLVSNTGTVVIEIYDNTGIEVERALLNQDTREFEYWYGFADGVESEHYVATATKVLPSFTGMGETLTIEGVPTSAYESTKLETGKAYSGTPSEIVTAVANDEGWKIENIVPSKSQDTTSESYDKTTKFTVYRSAYESATSFIVNKVAPYAVTEDNKGNFQLVVSENNGGTTVSFFPAGTVASETVYTYMIGSVSEKVISFEPQYSEFYSAILGSNGGVSETVDSITNEKVATIASVNKSPAEVGDVCKSMLPKSKVAEKSSSTASQQEAATKNTVKALSAASYQATLVVVGDPNVKVGSNIMVKVYALDGTEHFSSGEYMVQSSEDLIDGAFTTTMTLIRASQADVQASTDVSTSDYKTYSQGSDLGDFTITAYCCCKICCGKYSYEVTGKKNTTKSGTIPQQGRTIAVDPSVIPLRSKVMFNDHVYTAEDIGGKIKGNHIDLYFDKHSDAVNWGTRTMPVYKVEASVETPKSAPSTTNGNVPASVYYTACSKYLGIPYVWGGKSISNGLDCSGFVGNVVRDLGKSYFPLGAARDQQKIGELIKISGPGYGLENALPGDLLFHGNPATHVMMYLGNGYIAHSPHKRDVVKIAKAYRKPSTIRRIFG